MVTLAVLSRPADDLQWFTASKAGRALGRGVGGRSHAEALYSSRNWSLLMRSQKNLMLHVSQYLERPLGLQRL